MAIREIRQVGDSVLTKKCKTVTRINHRTKVLIDDMKDTMYDYGGIGLAAPQVGVLKRITIIDIGEGPIVLINPEIVASSGSQTGEEGCLSLLGKWGMVSRPEAVAVRALDENMEEFEMSGEGLLARAICHELDHLDGEMYMKLVEGELQDVVEEVEGEEESQETDAKPDGSEDVEKSEEIKRLEEEMARTMAEKKLVEADLKIVEEELKRREELEKNEKPKKSEELAEEKSCE